MLKKYKFDWKQFKIGLRTAKTGLAVFCVIFLFWVLQRDGIQIAALAAVFSLREDFDKSVHFGLSRILGNSIGGLYAILFFLLNDHFHQHGLITLIFLPIFTMLTITTSVAMNNAAGVISGVATLLIIALAIPSGYSILYALNRVFDTFIGVFIAVLVNSDVNKWRDHLKKRTM